jgi:hypothetical protein
METEIRLFPVINRHARDIGGQEIAGKLNPLIAEAQDTGQRMSQCCLANTWDVFDQQMSPCDNAGDTQANLNRLAEDDLIEGINGSVQSRQRLDARGLAGLDFA